MGARQNRQFSANDTLPQKAGIGLIVNKMHDRMPWDGSTVGLPWQGLLCYLGICKAVAPYNILFPYFRPLTFSF
jgi:hypothetical protein